MATGGWLGTILNIPGIKYASINRMRSSRTFLLFRSISSCRTSSAAIVAQNATAEDKEKVYQKDTLDLTFENTKAAYKSKTTWEILRALMVLKLATYDYLVENNAQLMKLGRKFLGARLFRFLMRQTFYGHFVAGENVKDIQPTLKRMHSFGVKSILDYSAEEDLGEGTAEQKAQNEDLYSSGGGKLGDTRKKILARTYFYIDEAQCEKNMEIFLKCINAVSGVTQSTGFAAIKVTALGRPQILLQLSEIINQTRKFFRSGSDDDDSIQLTPESLKKKFEMSKKEKTHVEGWLERVDYNRQTLMNLFTWSGLVDLEYVTSDSFQVMNIQKAKPKPILSALSDEEEDMFRNMMRRLHTIAQVAKEKDIRVMIDAEQTYFQPAINRITMELMRKYNKEKAIIFNTYQCYLKEAHNNLLLDLEIAERQSVYFGAKLVRGAYMEHERLRASKMQLPDPINPTYEATSDMYHRCLTEALLKIVERNIDDKIAVMVASHNEDSVRFTIKKMEEFGIRPEHRVVCFGQLLGMCDQVSFLLGQAGYSVYKYVPYGPIEEVLPYLSRRAQENNGLLKKSSRERKLLWKELVRRFSDKELFYTPIGNYRPP